MNLESHHPLLHLTTTYLYKIKKNCFLSLVPFATARKIGKKIVTDATKNLSPPQVPKVIYGGMF